MIFKDIFVYPEPVDYDSTVVTSFKMQSWSICLYLIREIKTKKIISDNFNRICFIGKEKPFNEGFVNSCNVLSVDVPFDLNEYSTRPLDSMNELFIQMLSYGINICISKHKLPLDFLLKSLEEFRRNGYENKWTWGRKRIKGTALTCEIICEVTMDKFYAEFIVSDKTTIIYRRDILTDKPSWISNSYFLKNKFLIRDDKILLADNLGKITFEEKISKLKKLI